MGFQIISEGGDGLGLAVRLKAEGHRVEMWIRDPALADRGEGLVDKNDGPSEFNPVILADCTGCGALLDVYRQNDTLTFGGSAVADRLETDRKYASSIFKTSKVKQPKAKEFDNWEEAEAFVLEAGDETRLVFKPEGKWSGNLPSYVSHDNEELLRMLKHFKGIVGEKAEFVLQEFVEGTCISSEAWYSRDHFVRPFNHTLERKQLMSGDIGPSGGCTGNVVWACRDEGCPLCESLLKIEPFLEENAFNGAIDINSVVSKDGEVYALEFTPRFGYDAFPTFLLGLFDGDFGGFLGDCAAGRGPDEMPLRDGFAAGIRLSVPPWPSEDFKARAGLPIRGLSRSRLDSFYPFEVSFIDDEFVTSGGCGIIGVAVGHGATIEESFEDVYKFIKKIKLPDMQYRNDLCEVFKKDVKQLRSSLLGQSLHY